MHYIFFFLKPNEQLDSLLLHIFYIIDFLSICKCQLNENLLSWRCHNNIWFDILLNIPHSIQNPSLFLIELKPFFSSSFSVNGDAATGKQFWHFFPCDLTMCLVLMTDAKYIVCLSFPCPQAKPNWVFKVD